MKYWYGSRYQKKECIRTCKKSNLLRYLSIVLSHTWIALLCFSVEVSLIKLNQCVTSTTTLLDPWNTIYEPRSAEMSLFDMEKGTTTDIDACPCLSLLLWTVLFAVPPNLDFQEANPSKMPRSLPESLPILSGGRLLAGAPPESVKLCQRRRLERSWATVPNWREPFCWSKHVANHEAEVHMCCKCIQMCFR